MCGIAGIYTYGEPPTLHAAAGVRAMRDAMVARGPDGNGEWVSEDRRVAMGHRRLSVIDLSEAASQPMTAQGLGLTITFNGEIYNYRDLRRQLSARGYQSKSSSDTEVLLQLYAEYGVQMFDHLRGMYAFALWDSRRRTILLARDPFGIKPLYYSNNGHEVRFASQVKALLASDGIPLHPDPAGHVGFYLWGSVPEPFTLFRNIRALRPGSFMVITDKGPKEELSFCSVPQVILEATTMAGSESGNLNTERLRELLVDAVSDHLVADVPVAVFLSAGIDSNVIASLARQVGQQKLHSLTVGFAEFRGTTSDEVSLAESAARIYETAHQTIIPTAADFKNDLPAFLRAMDQPTIDGFNVYCVSKIAATLGLKVCLSGLGGDEMFGGYNCFTEIPKLVNAMRILKPPRTLGRAFRYISSKWLGAFTSPKYAGIFEFGRDVEGSYLLRRGLFMPWELPELMPPEMVRDGWSELSIMDRLRATLSGLPSMRARIGSLELCWYMRNQLLRDADWAGMAHSIEIRVPFLDLPLLRAITPSWMTNTPISKANIAEASSISEHIAQRKKSGFSTPVMEWFLGQMNPTYRQARGLRDWARYVITQSGKNPTAANEEPTNLHPFLN